MKTEFAAGLNGKGGSMLRPYKDNGNETRLARGGANGGVYRG